MSEKCGEKVVYSKRQAERMKARVGRQIDKSMRIYECPKCFGWHLTKKEGKY